jgi:hypothetical protein
VSDHFWDCSIRVLNFGTAALVLISGTATLALISGTAALAFSFWIAECKRSFLGLQHSSAQFWDCSISPHFWDRSFTVLNFGTARLVLISGAVLIFPHVPYAIVPCHTGTSVYCRYECIKVKVNSP